MGVINWELFKAPESMIPHRLSQKALVAVAHIIRRGLVILLIKELMKYLFSIFVSYLFVYFGTLHARNILLHAYPPRISISIYFPCQTIRLDHSTSPFYNQDPSKEENYKKDPRSPVRLPPLLRSGRLNRSSANPRAPSPPPEDLEHR